MAEAKAEAKKYSGIKDLSWILSIATKDELHKTRRREILKVVFLVF